MSWIWRVIACLLFGAIVIFCWLFPMWAASYGVPIKDSEVVFAVYSLFAGLIAGVLNLVLGFAILMWDNPKSLPPWTVLPAFLGVVYGFCNQSWMGGVIFTVTCWVAYSVAVNMTKHAVKLMKAASDQPAGEST
ncbi:hypothetical protein KKI23_00170 [Patescibacteria group bacterium]|nr:hypothetical protein [Patescibacteria group bacterium]